MLTTTSRRSVWSVLRAYRQIGRLRARTGPIWISLVRLCFPLIALVYFLLLPKPPAELTAASGMLALSCAVGSLVAVEILDVIVGWQRFRAMRPLVKLVDREPVLEPMIMQRERFGVGEEELPLMAFAVSGNAATLKKMRGLLHLSPEEVGRALRVPSVHVVGLERGTKDMSEREWGIVLREVLRLGEEKGVRITGAGGGLTPTRSPRMR